MSVGLAPKRSGEAPLISTWRTVAAASSVLAAHPSDVPSCEVCGACPKICQLSPGGGWGGEAGRRGRERGVGGGGGGGRGTGSGAGGVGEARRERKGGSGTVREMERGREGVGGYVG